MSVQVIQRVWENSAQDGARLLLLLAIADHADRNGFCWPGIERLAGMIRMSRRQTSRLVSELKQSGELLVFERAGRVNLYIVSVGATQDQINAALVQVESRGVSPEDETQDIAMSWVPGSEPRTQLCPDTQDISAPGQDIPAPPQDIAMSHQSGHSYVPRSVIDPSLDPSLEPLWNKTLSDLQGQMMQATFDQHLAGSRLVAAENGTWRVQVRNKGSPDWLNGRLQSQVVQALQRHAPSVAEVRFEALEAG